MNYGFVAKDHTQLDLETEQKKLQAVFDTQKNRVVYEGHQVTLDLISNLSSLQPDVLHFSGHGTFKEIPGVAHDEGMGQIIIRKDASGQSKELSVGQFSVAVKASNCYAVVMNSCLGGKVDGVNQWTGIAPALSGAGVPIVLAMQFEVDDLVAISFSQTLYGALMRNESFDEALCSARIAAQGVGQQVANMQNLSPLRDWGAPVLYLRTESSNNLFPDAKSSGGTTITWTSALLRELLDGCLSRNEMHDFAMYNNNFMPVFDNLGDEPSKPKWRNGLIQHATLKGFEEDLANGVKNLAPQKFVDFVKSKST